MGINHITLMGVVSRGPEFRMTQSGIPTASFTVAVTRPARQDGAPDITDYVRVVAWRQLAEKVQETLVNNEMVVVEGRLTTRSYETNDGQRRKVVEVEASAVTPLKGAGGGAPARPTTGEEPEGPIYDDDFGDLEEAAPPPSAARPAPAVKRAAPPPKAPAPAADFDDEIPF
jgi:single-strand DNA-binding protein